MLSRRGLFRRAGAALIGVGAGAVFGFPRAEDAAVAPEDVSWTASGGEVSALGAVVYDDYSFAVPESAHIIGGRIFDGGERAYNALDLWPESHPYESPVDDLLVTIRFEPDGTMRLV